MKPSSSRPDFVEEDAADRGLDDLLVGVAEDGLLAEIRIRQADPLVRRHRAVAEAKSTSLFEPNSFSVFGFVAAGVRGSAVR